MSEEGKQDSNQEVSQNTDKEEKKEVEIQYVIIQLADGRKGIFVGPMLVTAVELTLTPPRIVSVDFTTPKPKDHGVDNETSAGVNPDTTVPKAS